MQNRKSVGPRIEHSLDIPAGTSSIHWIFLLLRKDEIM